MDILKRTISLEDAISRNSDTTYGLMTASTFHINIMLTQKIDNMGLFTDIDYLNLEPDYSILINKLNNLQISFPFMDDLNPPSIILTGFTSHLRLDNLNVSDWYKYGDKITGTTQSRLTELRSYNKVNRFIPNFNINTQTYINYDNQIVNGVDRIISFTTANTATYVFDANDDLNIGTDLQITGLKFSDNKSQPNNINTFDRDDASKVLSSIEFIGEGWNNTNTSLSALTKEEYLLGIINEPEIFSDVFIDRGNTSVMELHLKLAEVESVQHLENFGNGFYNLVKI